jgi:hypothetical protein
VQYEENILMLLSLKQLRIRKKGLFILCTDITVSVHRQK